jgi:hypothetical protein
MVGRLAEFVQASTRFPDIVDALVHHVSSHATQLCHEEKGSKGDYQVVGYYDSSGVLTIILRAITLLAVDDDKPAEINMAPY